MRAKVVALSLQQVGGQPFLTIGIEVGQRSAECRYRHPVLDGAAHGLPPALLAFFQDGTEKRIEHQVLQLGIAVKGLLDAVQKLGPDDATPTPNGRDVAVVQVPVEVLAGCSEEGKALGGAQGAV